MKPENKSWNLESFVDALVVELDKTRETLAVKSINKPVSYTVKDMSLDLQIFPTYDGDEVQFTTAQPGEQGSSKVNIQLASITDQQVRSTTKRLASKDDVRIENMKDLDADTKKQLRKIGVTSIKDLEDIEKKNVDVEKAAPGKINYTNLANVIQKTKRNTTPPRIKKVSMSMSGNEPMLIIEGENLSVENKFEPVAVINQRLARVVRHGTDEIQIALEKEHLSQKDNQLVVTFDPYSVCRMNLKSKKD
jgi:hypothetical protein